jgi:hypothetical protein
MSAKTKTQTKQTEPNNSDDNDFEILFPEELPKTHAGPPTYEQWQVIKMTAPPSLPTKKK